MGDPQLEAAKPEAMAADIKPVMSEGQRMVMEKRALEKAEWDLKVAANTPLPSKKKKKGTPDALKEAAAMVAAAAPKGTKKERRKEAMKTHKALMLKKKKEVQGLGAGRGSSK